VISAVRDPRSAIRSPLLAIALVAALASTADAQTDSVRALLQVARRQASEGSAAAALDTLRKARARAPNAEDVLSAYAQMAIASRQPIVAVEVLEPLARMCPSVPQYQYMLGVAYMQAGAILASVDALRAAEALDPGNARVLAALGIALNTRKLHGEAQPVLARSIEIEPENVEAIAALAEAEEGLGDPLAETHAMRALAMNPAHATANYVLGVVRMRQQKYDEARDALLKAIASDQQMARAHYQVSLAYSRLGDEAQARVHVELYQQQMQALEDAAKKLRR
jgi:tetratricopeptide (TPR) repeat protein